MSQSHVSKPLRQENCLPQTTLEPGRWSTLLHASYVYPGGAGPLLPAELCNPRHYAQRLGFPPARGTLFLLKAVCP